MTEDDYKFRKSYIRMPMIFCFLLGFWLIYDSSKTVEDVYRLEGKIAAKELLKESYHGNKFRYTYAFRLDNSDQILGIFLGSGKGAIEKGHEYDALFKIGDPITVFFDNNLATEYEGITRFVYQIDHKGTTVLKRNQKPRQIIGYSLLVVGLVFVFLRIWLTKKYNRELNEITVANTA